MAVSYLPCGDCGLTVEFGQGIDRKLSQQIMALRAAVEDAGLAGVIETVPTYRSLLIHYDPLATSQADLIAAVDPLIAGIDDTSKAAARRWELPICFDDEFSPDLGNVAEFGKMSPDAVMDVITSVEHFIYMLGFAPGLPYMGDLPEALAIPRKKTPIKHVPKGSVLVATGLTLIYPAVNPTGWHIIGRCPVPIFDVEREDPVLLTAGDRVSFNKVSRAEYDEIEAKVAAGSYEIEGRTV
ncbi:sensor histidine kinase inhibitor, KipI family [Cohaesibacter sp. ES.047]|uniref:5-oxoprolinase subunit PxpB n=1 Tax=Cohaesibacter sp. ES.047 TaxID=1798205 RepID=UPI000BB81335|nr:5-oxoprolinase subunit PxpB [Cohaesibacter sp. ES.047]SNY91260.1 sensor histidine kinase inhibitor, KipI family [Cohaesibacter sp. ES.047]